MINFDNLQNWIFKYIDSHSSKQTIIYIGGGTYCYSTTNNTNIKFWKYEENQQFPPFLHDFKSININIQILIILIDPAFDCYIPPYIVDCTDQYYSHSWTKSKEYMNLFHSTFGIDVITIKDKIVWSDNYQEEQDAFDFVNLIVNISNNISEPNSNTLLFYHEFTGSSLLMLENMVKKKSTNFNPNKICIDITRGSDMSCYFNLSNPEFYPVILFDDNNKLQYANPEILSNDKKIQIISQYKKFTNGFGIKDYEYESKPEYEYEYEYGSKCNYSLLEPNYLLYTNPNIILCFQIINLDKIIFYTISDKLISMIRYLYTCENYTCLNDNIRMICNISKLKYYIKNFDYSNQIECIQEDLNLIELINSNISENPDYKETTSFLKSSIISRLFNIIKNTLETILVKYQINIFIIENFIENIKQLNDKYEMIPFYKKFISSLNIII